MKALFNFFIFLFLLILSCRSQTSNELTKQTPIDGLGYSDHEGYHASFVTGENFGCIYFKAKE